MEKAKVYFTDFHTVAFGDGLPAKLKKLMRAAGIDTIDMDGKFVAIKIDCTAKTCHFMSLEMGQAEKYVRVHHSTL